MVNALLFLLLIITGFAAIFIFCHLALWIFWFVVSRTISKNKEYDKPSAFYNWVFVLWYRYMMIVGNIRLHCTGCGKIPDDRKFLLISNHCSKFDNFIHCAVLKKYQLAYVSKPENFKIPIGGRFMRRGLYLSLPRGNTKEELKTIMKAIRYIKENKVSIGIFPEGSRSKDGNLQEFKPGAFKIAEKTQCPVVVCCMKGTIDIHKNCPWKKTDVYMDILEVIEPSIWKEKNTVEVSQYAHDLIQNNLNKAN